MNKIREIFKSNFAKSIVLISGGTLLAQIINILLSPILTRIYNPQDYGVLTVYTSILGMLAIISTFKYEWGIPIAEDDKKAINVFALSFIILILYTVLISILLLFFGNGFLNLFNANKLSGFKYTIPIGIFGVGAYNILIQWTYRKKGYKSISKTKLSQAIFSNITKIIFGISNFNAIGLILGRIVGQSAGIKTLSKELNKTKNILREINIKDIKYSFKRYIKFLYFSTPSEFFNVAGLQLPVLFLTGLFDEKVTGYFGLTNSIVNLPMVLIGGSVSDVFYGEVASIGKKDPKRIKDLYRKLLKKLILIGLIPLIILLLFGPFLFSLVFGSEWYEAGVYSRIISFLVFFRLIFTPISSLYIAFERQKEVFIIDLLRVILVFFSFSISKYFSLNVYITIGLYSFSMSLIYFITFFNAQKILNDEIKKQTTI